MVPGHCWVIAGRGAKMTLIAGMCVAELHGQMQGGGPMRGDAMHGLL